MSKPILVILILIASAAIIGSVVDSGSHARDAAIAAVIGTFAIIAGLLPVRFAADRTAVGLFQSAWIGSILHLTVFLALSGTVIFTRSSLGKPPTAFVMWLLGMYWLTLAGLCITLVRVMRSEIHHAASPVTKGE
jgi:hypothetical protein